MFKYEVYTTLLDTVDLDQHLVRCDVNITHGDIYVKVSRLGIGDTFLEAEESAAKRANEDAKLTLADMQRLARVQHPHIVPPIEEHKLQHMLRPDSDQDNINVPF